MRINAVTQPIASELRKIESIRKSERDNKSGKANTSEKPVFSSDAQKLSETKAQFEAIASSLAAQPEIRNEKINEVKRKVESGYYNSEEFIDKLAEKLMKEFGINQ